MSAALEALIAQHALPEPVYVTRPSLPPLEAYRASLEEIWRSQWLTNDGSFVRRFERGLADQLGVERVAAFSNGTIALLVALGALGVTEGEVITTPFTFPATVHVLRWSGLTPVFADLTPGRLTLDPDAAERAITERTVAILPVHVYGIPCDVEAFQRLSDRHGLPVIYDGAPALGTRLHGRSLASYGDCCMLSFHATKLLTTAEGGALVVSDPEFFERCRRSRNFGILDEETVACVGINGKLSELHAALGCLQFETVGEEIRRRGALVDRYRAGLAGVPGIEHVGFEGPEVEPSHAYMPVRIQADAFGHSRDQVHDVLRRCNVYARKYYYPLCSEQPGQDAQDDPQVALPVAYEASREVLCLPLYGALPEAAVDTTVELLRALHLLEGPLP